MHLTLTFETDDVGKVQKILDLVKNEKGAEARLSVRQNKQSIGTEFAQQFEQETGSKLSPREWNKAHPETRYHENTSAPWEKVVPLEEDPERGTVKVSTSGPLRPGEHLAKEIEERNDVCPF